MGPIVGMWKPFGPKVYPIFLHGFFWGRWGSKVHRALGLEGFASTLRSKGFLIFVVVGLQGLISGVQTKLFLALGSMRS